MQPRGSRTFYKNKNSSEPIKSSPVTTAFSSLNPGIIGIDSVIAVEGVHKVQPCSYSCRELSVSWITPGNCAGYWRDQPGRPFEKLGGRTAPTCSRGYPGPQTMPKYRINKTTHQPELKKSKYSLHQTSMRKLQRRERTELIYDEAGEA